MFQDCFEVDVQLILGTALLAQPFSQKILKHNRWLFIVYDALARLSVRSKKERKAENTRKREARQRTRHVFQNKENLKAAPLPPTPVWPEALDVPASSLPSRAKIGKHGWTKSSRNEAREVPK